jgi:Dodecin
MKNHVYKMLELVGSSETSIEDAITTAIAQANKTASKSSKHAGTLRMAVPLPDLLIFGIVAPRLKSSALELIDARNARSVRLAEWRPRLPESG